ncbi:MAG TPA: PAS domain S-box protein [Burkholderiales bacterium]|nr:PAS domain S-box protein [Burkholderiales bacterium]
MARINYAIRAGSFAYCFLVLAIHGAERGVGAIFWTALALQFLVYPHLAYLHARRAADSARAERINLHVDAAFLGLWIGALHFPLWIAYAAAFSITLNATVVFGIARGAFCFAIFCAGAAIALPAAGFELAQPTSRLVTTLCVVGSFGYSCAVGAVVYSLRDRLRESESRYRLLAENAADLVALVDTDGNWLYASPSFEAVLKRQELAPGTDAFAYAHQDDAEKARMAVRRAAATLQSRPIALRLLDRTGRFRQYQATVTPVKGEPRPARRLVLALRDVTDLRESEERLLVAAHALEGMTQAIMITGGDGTILSVNRAYTETTGRGADEVVGQPEKMFRSPLVREGFFDDALAAVLRKGFWSGTHSAKRKSGAVYLEWRSIRAVRDAAGAITHFVHSFYEVSVPRNGNEGGIAANGREA